MVETTEIVSGKQNIDAVHCLTIPVEDEVMLLPNAAIAEVVSYKEPTPLNDAPDWFLGYIDWRDRRIPLVSFEAISGKTAAGLKKNSRVMILNTLNGNPELPYFAIVSQGLPSLAIVNQHGLKEKNPDEKRQAISAFVNVGGLQAIIPNIDEIEQRLLKLHSH